MVNNCSKFIDDRFRGYELRHTDRWTDRHSHYYPPFKGIKTLYTDEVIIHGRIFTCTWLIVNKCYLAMTDVLQMARRN
jgi:hypothetical protein